MAGKRAEDLAADYAGAGFGGVLGLGDRPALVIVDVAMAYLLPESPLYLGNTVVLDVNIALAEAARAAGLPVVFTRVLYQSGGIDGGLFYKRVKALSCFDAGNPLGDFHPRLQPLEGDLVIVKQYPSAFFGTSLAPTLHALECDGCIITGFSTSGCVRATALDALCHGFRSTVVSDGCADRDAEVHQGNLFDLAQKYADVIVSAEVLERLTQITAD